VGDSALDAVNATVAENTAAGPGGGILAGPGSALSLNAVTIAANEARGHTGGGVELAPGAAATVENSLVARNVAAVGPDCHGAGIVSGGGNVFGSPAGCPGLAGVGDLVRPRPRIGSLADNGGPTPTVALLRRSPAIGAAAADAPSRDQRNLARRDPDAGAYERR
jgi:hypothetical protein